jgi:hypothetical protein
MNAITPKKLTYDEMLSVVRSIHPEMKLRVTGPNKDEWEMFLTTNHIQPSELSDRFKDTPASELLNRAYSGFDNALESYRHKNGLGGLPLDGVAEHYNLYAEQQNWGIAVQTRLLHEDGTDFSWDGEVTNEQFSAYKKTISKVRKLMDAEFKDKWNALKDKWRY